MTVTRAIGAAALFLMTLSSEAYAARQHRPGERISCSEVKYYVAKYSAGLAEMYAVTTGPPAPRSSGRGVAWPRMRLPKQGNAGPIANEHDAAFVIKRAGRGYPARSGLYAYPRSQLTIEVS